MRFVFAFFSSSVNDASIVNLTFDLLTPKLIVLCPCPAWCTANLHLNKFIRFQNIVFKMLV